MRSHPTCCDRSLVNRDFRSFRYLALAVVGAGLLGFGCKRKPPAVMAPVASAPATPVDFNRHIRPLLNQNCVVCHGGVKMAGNISFVFREEATRAGESGRITIKPGDPAASELMARLVTKDPEKRMPPVDHGHALAPEQIELFRQWIKEGAPWAEHWSFVPPKLPPVPEIPAANAVHARGPIDRFILARLAHERLAPSPEADRATLLRRVSLDLTGLPPTAGETAAFLADAAPQAYERQVDRLLASPHYGERWASIWMDLARYADSKGYEKDIGRSVWKYRDWLIDALNRNQPYDQFVVDQLAGDLLPGATIEQRIATAFHRQTQANDEAGTDDEEYRLLAVQDRAVTTWTAFNGVSFNCVQCHSHPYDPIRHQEYYSFLAFFNNTADADLYVNDYPTLHVPDDPSRYAEALKLQEEVASFRKQLARTGKQLAAEPEMWRPLTPQSATARPELKFELRKGEIFVMGSVPKDARYDFLLDLPAGELSAIRLEVLPLDPEKSRHTPEAGFIVNKIEAWLVKPDGTEEAIGWGSFWMDSDNLPAELEERKNFAKNAAEIAKTGSGKPGIPTVRPTFTDLPFGGFAGEPTLDRMRWVVGVPATPVRSAPGSRLKLRLEHSRVISAKPAVVRRVRVVASTDQRWTRLAWETHAETTWRQLNDQEEKLLGIPGTQLPVMADLGPDDQREMRVFSRGNFLNKVGKPLEPDVPKLFPPLPKDAPRNRLTLARWLTQPGQPLTSRVAVNRYWEQLFGIGLVETLEDFGSVGTAPSHPELLDWLALRFEHDLHWDVKAFLREVVTSATYRQSARNTPELREKDPRNRLLARGPRNRLNAEMVRDQALVASGLFSPKLHGPPVMPPQPAGVWVAFAEGLDSTQWIDAKGPDRYRRALYTYWKRSNPYPSFITFDAPVRDVCTLRRLPTNTPLQALVTLNDPVYMEAAAALATRMQTKGGSDPRAEIAQGFQLAATRPPTPGELAPLLALYQDSLGFYRADAGLLKASGSPDEVHAALTSVASAILNLDVVLTK